MALTRGRLVAVAVLLLAAGAVAAVALGSGSAPRAQAGTGVPAGETTTEVTRRTLTESSTLDGTLTYNGQTQVYDRLSSAGTFTWLPAVGAVVKRGGRLFSVNQEPVVLMYGTVPAYRTLKEGLSSGTDVRELNENLIDLGYDPYGEISDTHTFSAATAAAVRRWQKAQGLAQTGEVPLGRVVFASGAQRVTKVHVVLGQDPPGQPEAGEPGARPPDAGETGTGQPGSGEPASGKAGPGEPASGKAAPGEPAVGKGVPGEPASGKASGEPARGKSKQSESGPGKSGSKQPASKSSGQGESSSKDAASAGSSVGGKSPASHGSAGEGGGGGMLVLSTSSTQQTVQLKLKADEQRLAHVGESAPVTLPNGNVVQGRVVEVGSVASESGESEHGGGEGGGAGGGSGGSGTGESATVPVTLRLEHSVRRMDEAPVSVQLVKTVRREVLAVPATALTALAGGGYGIETLQGSGRVMVPVTPGLFAGGYVQIEGAGVREGMTVIESE